VKPILVRKVVFALRCPFCGFEWIPKRKSFQEDRKAMPKYCPCCNRRLLPEYDFEEKDAVLQKLRKLEEENAALRKQLEQLLKKTRPFLHVLKPESLSP